MNKFKSGTKVRLVYDPESIYEVVDNPFEREKISIRLFGDGMIIIVNPIDIVEIRESDKP